MKLTVRACSRLVLSLSIPLVLGGCAEERAPINRVQPDALEKGFFVGRLDDDADDPEFYKRGTVIDVDYGASQDSLFTSTYGQPVSRIRWEITETALNARLSYERVTGTEGTGETRNGAGIPTRAGQIVASYAISSHFDIQRDYNPQTGEPLNVVVENTGDRPWYARKFMRVDWSQNLITEAYDFDTLSQMGIYGGVTYEPMSYTVLDPSDPDAPHFEPGAGYFDVTNKVYARPQNVDLSSLGWGIDTLPACWLDGVFHGGSWPVGNCNPTELTIRESFRRVVDNDYEPMDEDGVRFQVLGAFNVERHAYDRSYGMLDSDWHRFISRYNIWDRSHYYEDPATLTGPVACATKETTEDPTGDPAADPNRDDDGDGTADECQAAGAGSRCDVFKNKCTLPFSERRSLTIPWYMAGDETYFDPSDWAVQEWDLAMKTAVQTSRLTECRKVGRGSDCDIAYPMWTGQQDDNEEAAAISRELYACHRARGWSEVSCVAEARAAVEALAGARGDAQDPSTLAIFDVINLPPVFTLCHAPVLESDHPACGPRGLNPRLGDLRYHLVLAVEGPQVPSPWGIMADADDPLTGEKLAGSMNIWTHVTDTAAQQLLDLVRYSNGELPTEQITNGDYVRRFAAAAKLGARGALPTLSKAEVDQRLASASSLDPKAFAELATREPLEQEATMLNALRSRVLDVEARSDVLSPSLARAAATLGQGRGTAVETNLINSPMLQLVGVPASAPFDANVMKLASPLGMNNPHLRARFKEMRENALAARGACILHEAPEPSGVAGLAEILRAKFPPAEGETASDQSARNQRMLDYIRRRYHYAIMAHEMGHSVGLRHNFVSSSAAMFYRPQYWQLRTKNGQVSQPCQDVTDDGSTCVGPRYWDPVTDEEQSQLIWMFMHSTVMDYPGDVSQDMIGLGVTDYAAARFFYGDTTSVFSDQKYAAGSTIGTGISAATDTFGGLVGIRYGFRAGGFNNGITDFHYSGLQRTYGMIDDCYEVTPTQPASWDEAVDGVWHPVLDGLTVSIDGVPTKCRQPRVDYVPYTSLRRPTSAELNASFYRGGPSVDPAGRTRVPYAFATDNWADLGNVSVLRHDNGADPYEQVNFLITTQEVRHILDNYRRDRTSFSILAASDRSFTRYNSKMMQMVGGLGFLRTIYQDLAPNQGYSFESVWPRVVASQAPENMIASTVAFDHFTRALARPQPGDHYYRADVFEDEVLRSNTDADDYGGSTSVVVIPNGTTGYVQDVGFGGHPLENALSETNGDFDVDYIQNVGSYYDKINTALIFAESEDRFVSQSRRDFYDSRFRAVGVADLLPDGFRRTIANALTGDRSMLAPRLLTDDQGSPLLDEQADTSLDPLASQYPASPLGWPSLWPAAGPQTCFATLGRNACMSSVDETTLNPINPANTAPVDPQIGWEVQKFLIAWTISYIKANEKSQWIDMMRIFRAGANSDPRLGQQIEWADPTSGAVYSASTFGTECFYGAGDDCAGGRVVQKGIAARVLEYANELTAKAYELDEDDFPETERYPAGFNEFGRAMVLRHPNGMPIVRVDPAVQKIGGSRLVDNEPCDQNEDPECTPLTVTDNHFAHELEGYKSVPDFLWLAADVYGLLGEPAVRGTYP